MTARPPSLPYCFRLRSSRALCTLRCHGRPSRPLLRVIPQVSTRMKAQPCLCSIQQQLRSASTSMPSSNNNSEFQLDNLFNVRGKVALVTGGGSGIGLMATQALAVNGAKVYIVGRTEEKLETVAKTYGKDIPGEIIPITADVSRKEEIKKLVSEISSREKCLCIL